MLVYLISLKMSLTSEWLKEKWLFIVLLMFMLIAYSLIIAIGRINTVGLEEALTNNLYYSYTFWVFFVILVYALIDFKGFEENYFLKLKILSVGLLSILIALNAMLTLNMNWKMFKWSKPAITLVKDIEMLIQEHHYEKDFSFSVVSYCPGNNIIDWLRRDGDLPNKRYTFAEALFPTYYREKDGKYVIGMTSKHVSFRVPQVIIIEKHYKVI